MTTGLLRTFFALFWLLGLTGDSLSPIFQRLLSATVSVNNYEECVKAGYPTGTAAGQERCWTPKGFRIFVKGLNPTIRQGLYGTITLITGNCMPSMVDVDRQGNIIVSPGPNPCRLTVIDREIYIMEPIEGSHRWGGPYLPVDSSAVKSTKSTNGIYEVELPAGTYSVFVEDNGKKYCNRSGMKGEACQITIRDGQRWEYNIEIDHAVY